MNAWGILKISMKEIGGGFDESYNNEKYNSAFLLFFPSLR